MQKRSRNRIIQPIRADNRLFIMSCNQIETDIAAYADLVRHEQTTHFLMTPDLMSR